MEENNTAMKRLDFLKCAGLCGAAGLVGGATVPAAMATGDGANAANPLVIRPYQLLCTICSMGADDTSSPHYAKAMKIREAIRKNPDVPVTLACHGGALYSFQDSGSEDDTPESFEYNQKRDFNSKRVRYALTIHGCSAPWQFCEMYSRGEREYGIAG